MRPWCSMADPIAVLAVSSCFLLPFVFVRWFATLWPAPDEPDAAGSSRSQHS